MKAKKNIFIVLLLITTISINIVIPEHSSIVSYKTYKEANNSQMLRKILEDNTIQQELPDMFNYASNGKYVNSFDLENGPQLGYDSTKITNGLYSMEDEDGLSYYFRGNVTNNNVQFGEYQEDYYVYEYIIDSDSSLYFQSLESCQQYNNSCSEGNKVKLASAGDKMYWKIIRVNGDGSLRLIYNGKSTTSVYGGDIIGISPYNLNFGDVKYGGYTYDRDSNEIDSFIKNEVDIWYNNTLGNNSSYDSKISFGRFCSDSSGYRFNEVTNNNTFSFYDRIGLSKLLQDGEYQINPTLKCLNTDKNYGGSYNLKVGLITADEVVLAGEAIYVNSNSYLHNLPLTRGGLVRGNIWTMTLFSFQEIPAFLSNVCFNDDVGISSASVTDFGKIRPVINLDKDNIITGEGTSEDPYVVIEPDYYNYKGTVTMEEGSSVDDNTAFEEELNLDGVIWASDDESIAIIEDGKILGLKEGTTVITGVSGDGLTTYEIEVNVIKNPVTNSMIYIGIGLILILVLGTALYTVYRIKEIVNEG